MSDTKEYRRELNRLNREYEKAKKSGDAQRRGIYKRKINEHKKTYLSGEIERLKSGVLSSSEKGKLTRYRNELRRVNISISIQQKDREDRRYGRGIYKERTNEERKASAKKGAKTRKGNEYRRQWWEGLSSAEKSKITKEKNKEKKRLKVERSKRTKFKNKISKHIAESTAKSIEKINKKDWINVTNTDVDRYLEQKKREDKEPGYEFERAELLFSLYGFVPKELIDAIVRRYGVDYAEPFLSDIYHRDRTGQEAPINYKEIVARDLKLKNNRNPIGNLRSSYVSNYKSFDSNRVYVAKERYGKVTAAYGSYDYKEKYLDKLGLLKEHKVADKLDYQRHIALYGNPELLRGKLYGKKENAKVKTGNYKNNEKKRAKVMKNYAIKKTDALDINLKDRFKKLYDKLKPKSFRVDIKKAKNKFDFED